MLTRNHRGFSLIELLVVVVVIGIIVAIAVPNILSTRRAANEGSALATLKNLASGQMIYQSTIGSGGFAGTDAVTGDNIGIGLLREAQIIDRSVGSGFKSGYRFVGAVSTASSYATGFFFAANPISADGVARTGNNRFGMTHDGQIKGEVNQLATPYDANTILTAPQISR